MLSFSSCHSPAEHVHFIVLMSIYKENPQKTLELIEDNVTDKTAMYENSENG